MERYCDRLSWGRVVEINPCFPWNERTLTKYAKRINWGHLSNNPNLPWSAELVSQFWAYLGNRIGSILAHPKMSFDLTLADQYIQRSGYFPWPVWERLVEPVITPELYEKVFVVIAKNLPDKP